MFLFYYFYFEAACLFKLSVRIVGVGMLQIFIVLLSFDITLPTPTNDKGLVFTKNKMLRVKICN